MTRKNRYVSHAPLSPHQFRQLLRLFAVDLEAPKVADLTGLNRTTVNRSVLAIRQRSAQACDQDAPLQGTVEVDPSYFGPRRVKGARGRGAGSNTIVCGIDKRNGKVYTESAPTRKSAPCKPSCGGRWPAAASSTRIAGEGPMG